MSFFDKMRGLVVSIHARDRATQHGHVAARDSVMNVLAGLGTLRDKRSHTKWVMPLSLDPYQLDAMYRGSWLARKIVDIPAIDMTRAWTSIVFDDDNATLQFAIEQAETKLALQRAICDALTWSRLYGGAVLIIGTRENDLTKPLIPERVRRGALVYLRVIDKWNISAMPGLVNDPGSEHFGLPEFYQLPSGMRIHCSRVIRFDGARLPYQQWLNNAMWHDSVLQSVHDSLLNADTATQSVSSMLFEANVDVIKTEGLRDLIAEKDGEKKIARRFQIAAAIKSFNRALLIDTSEEYEKKSNTFSGIDAIMRQFMLDVSGAADIPMTRLFGQSATGLNATGDNDIRNYYDMVRARQEMELRPALEKLYRIIAMSALGHVPDDFRFEFKSLWQISETEKAGVEKIRAERDQIYLNAGVIPEATAARELMELGTYASLTEEDIQAVSEVAESLGSPEDGEDDPPEQQ